MHRQLHYGTYEATSSQSGEQEKKVKEPGIRTTIIGSIIIKHEST